MPNNGNGAENLALASGGDRWADRAKIVSAMAQELKTALSDAEVRAYFRVKIIEPKMRDRMARHKAELLYGAIVAALVEGATELVTAPFTGWAWKNGAVVYLVNARFEGLVWNAALRKWVDRVEKSGLNIPGFMRAGMYPAEKLNLTACNAMGAKLSDSWAGEPFKVPAMKNGVYASALFSRMLWPARKAQMIGAGWKLPTDAGFYLDTGTADVFIVYGPIAGAEVGDVVSVPWVNNTGGVYQIQKAADWVRDHPKDESGNEYEWAYGPHMNPPFLEKVKWRAFPELTGGVELRVWFSDKFTAELNK